jgi:hypothetical protein
MVNNQSGSHLHSQLACGLIKVMTHGHGNNLQCSRVIMHMAQMIGLRFIKMETMQGDSSSEGHHVALSDTFHWGSLRSNSLAPTADQNGSLDFFDISQFLSSFSAQDSQADFNNDGVFNFFDVSAFLSAFSAGCP